MDTELIKNFAIRLVNQGDSFKNKLQRPYFDLLRSYPEIDYGWLTVVIPYRKSTDQEREENLDVTLNYLSRIGIPKVVVSEHSDVSVKNRLMERYGDMFKSFQVVHTPAGGEEFNRARARNRGVMHSDTPYIATSDLDCITRKKNIDFSLALLERGFDVVHPFNRRITDVVDKEEFREEYDFDRVKTPEQRRKTADGGIIFWNKRSFVFIGMENEYFLGWGGEDNEIMYRAMICRLKRYRIDDTLYHLYHHRPQERTRTNLELEEQTRQIKTKDECLKRINKWPWVVEAKKKFHINMFDGQNWL